MLVLIISALSIGFLGSFHCVAMCGPIALALPLNQGSPLKKLMALFIYHSGRILTYSLLGLLLAMAGQGFAMIGIQQIVSVVLGVLVLLFLFFPTAWFAKFSITRPLSVLFLKLQNAFSFLISKRNPGAMFLMGLLNGLLPCGLVYLALAAALASNNMVEGMVFMAFFGSATLPIMLALSLFRNRINQRMRNGMKKLTPYLISAMAVLMIVRGLNLGIPYISPEYHAAKAEVTCCEESEQDDECCKKEGEKVSCCEKEK